MLFKIAEITKNFRLNGDVVDCKQIGNGHINLTYLCETSTGEKYLLQRINNEVFKDVDLLMSNYYKICKFLEEHNFGTIHLIKANNGKYYHETSFGIFRLYRFIDNVVCYERCDSMELVYKAASSFGKLHKILNKFDTNELGEVIKNFHNTSIRYQNLLDAIKEDKLGRVASCFDEIKRVNRFQDYFSIITDGIKNGDIHFAVTHNDPKINNVLFDKDSGDIRAVIDLDTVMPGSYLYDFGDALRSLFTKDNEDNEDLSKLVVDYEIFENYVKGYLSEMNSILTSKEIELLGFSTFLLSIECGMRFLEDFLRGDVYFAVSKANHNLIRARTQITLAENIFSNLNNLNNIVNKHLQF